MYHFKLLFFTLLVIVGISKSIINCSPLDHTHYEINHSIDNGLSSIEYRGAETEQVQEIQKPATLQEPIKQEPVKQEPVKQEPVKQEPVKEQPIKQEPIKQQQEDEPIKSQPETNQKTEENPPCEDTNGAACVKAKPDYSKAIAIAAKGNAIAAVATAGVAAPVVLKSAKIAALASLIPVKLAAKGAILGTLIAKPIIIKSAIIGAAAAKLSHLLVGKPIAVGANILAGIEALRAKLKAKKVGCVAATCSSEAIA